MILRLLDRLRHEARRRSSSKTWTADQTSGRRGEDLAHRYLKRKGFKIVARNYRLAAGDAEADLIAWDAEELVIVEVKTRTTSEHGPPDRAISPDKQRALARVAREYARKTDTPGAAIRCDVVGIVLTDPPLIEHFRGSVRLSGIA